MELNSFVFPRPTPSYTHEDMFGKLIYIPRDYQQWDSVPPYVSSKKIVNIYKHREKLAVHGSYKGKCIPCLYLPWPEPSSKILLYFHGNAEDIALTQELAEVLQEHLRIHVIVMEYEGYGVYEGKTTAEQILQDSELLFHYIINVIGYSPSDVILFGRSIGSGPAAYLAGKYKVHSLILMSAFTSLRAVVKGFVGPFLQYIVAERFPNKDCISKVKCPVFLMHGQKDNIVSCEQAQELKSVLDATGTDSVLYMPEDMDHNSFDFENDFVTPLLRFYEERGFTIKPEPPKTGIIVLPLKAFNKPTGKLDK
eukprot:TRINITY_DN108020_c0_g1_i1.p1 TRINITY_DN108020_c0_g1~~TRINITY_DN108020_c0_g1_i1.p1  ORF type:complete len:349 (+),score=26.56 TRINITY_DN108020_c0_g1_i1:123-1049(+)